jgi:4'-phosphopantetheinyl transferase
VNLWVVDLDAYGAAAPPVEPPPEERFRTARLAAPEDASRFLAGRHALRLLLSRVLDRTPAEVALAADAYGKLHLANGDLHFNLAHSGGLALIGTSRDCAIGVDLEMHRPVVEAEALAAMHFTPGERAELARAGAATRDRAFLTCWTRKEACLKALGIGLAAPPASLEVGCTPERHEVVLEAAGAACRVTVRTIELPDGALGAVALAAPEAPALARRRFPPPSANRTG